MSWTVIDHPSFAMRDRYVAACRKALDGAKRATIRHRVNGRVETVPLPNPAAVEQLLERLAMLNGEGLTWELTHPDPAARRKPRRRRQPATAIHVEEADEHQLPAPDVNFWTGPDQPIVAFAREVLRFPLTPVQAAIVNRIYGDDVQTSVLRIGRRGGKGRLVAVVAAFEATVNADRHLAAVPPGEEVEIVIVATSQDQARRTHRYIRAFLRRPELAHLVEGTTDDEIRLRNGMLIVTVPCNAGSARGRSAAVVILDEAAWFSGKDASPLDVGALWSALVPASAMFPHRKILVTSTPRLAVGWFYDTCALAAAGKFGMVEFWATAAQANPKTDPAFLAAEREKDPVNYLREYEARFEAAISAALDAELVRSAIVPRGDLPPVRGVSYLAALDAGFSGDRTALVIGHRDADRRIVIDLVKAWQGSNRQPLPVEQTIGEVTELLGQYGRAPVAIDQFAAEPIAQAFARRGVGVLRRPWSNDSKLDALAALREELFGGRVELPTHQGLVGELITLEQRALPSGRPRIAAPGRDHDDYATALMALVAELRRGTTGQIHAGGDIWA